MTTSSALKSTTTAASVLVFVVLTACAAPAAASSITWESTGPVSVFGSIFSKYLSPGTTATLDLYADPNAPFQIDPFCPPGSGSGWWQFDAGVLTVGNFTWRTLRGGFIERNDENELCGRVGAKLDLMSFNWQFVGTPPDPALEFLYNVYAALTPYDADATTLGDELNAVNLANLIASNPGHNDFSFSGPFAPVPEPSTIVLLSTGAVTLLVRRRRSRPRR
jgi:hypothetical protein